MSQNNDETSSLLGHTGGPAGKKSDSKNLNKKKMTLISAVSVVIFLVYLQFRFSGAVETPEKKNVIFFITDGMGPASLSMTRAFNQYYYSLNYFDTLYVDKHFIGSSRTRSNDSLVTDSAAGATAFSCALKAYNGAIGVDPEKNPCGTVLEAAKLKGYMTGLVVTTRITDATPAAFSAHVDYRSQEDQIALQQLGHYSLGPVVDLLMGGGRTHFYPQNDTTYGNGGSRADGRNLINESIANGWQYVNNRKEFDALNNGTNVSLPLLALFADTDIPFDIDRDPEVYPSLEETSITAINALLEATKDSDKGFFLMIESSRIDHAGHQNDPSTQVREVLAFDRAFKAVKEHVENLNDNFVIISTSDHETGGLTNARQVTKTYPEYLWYPNVLANSNNSGEFLSRKISNYTSFEKPTSDELNDFINNEIFEKGLGIKDYHKNDTSEIVEVLDTDKNDPNNLFYDLLYKLNDMVSTRAQIGWTTHGHSGVDVNIYGYSNDRSLWYDLLDNLQGDHENTEIGDYLADYVGGNLDDVTKLLNGTDHSPPPSVKAALIKHGYIDVDGYHRNVIQCDHHH